MLARWHQLTAPHLLYLQHQSSDRRFIPSGLSVGKQQVSVLNDIRWDSHVQTS
jgi:hypothetical protein